MFKLTLLLLAAIFGIYTVLQKRDRFANVICSLQVLGIAMIISSKAQLQLVGFYALFAATLLAVIYALKPQHNTRKKAVLLLISVIVLAAYILKAFHLQGIAVLAWFMIIPVAAFIFMLKDYKNYEKEIGFASILAVEAGIRFSDLFLMAG
jgi:hypothetical protein